MIRPETVSVPLCVALPLVSVPKEAACAKRLVLEEMVAKELVEVAWVVVALTPVTFWSEVAPSTVSAPFALRAPPTERRLEIVVEPVIATVPVLVAPVVVSPPLNATSVDVAPLGNG